MLFDGFAGNDQAKALVAGMFDAGHIPHAILIDGPGGSGKKTLARIMAAAAVCEQFDSIDVNNGRHHKELPCGVCRQCQNAMSGNHPDIALFAGDNGARSFGVDLVRQIRTDAYVAPNDAERKVYILSNIQDMTEQAQNALLKILEEPPRFVIFIITCDTRMHVLETIRSRTQQIALHPVTELQAVHALQCQIAGLSDEAAMSAARLSGGIIGRARIILETGFDELFAFCNDFCNALCGSDIYAFVSLSGRLEKNSNLFISFLDIMPLLMCDAIAVKCGNKSSLSGCEEEARMLARNLTILQLYTELEAALESRRAADRYANTALHLTAFFARLWQDLHGEKANPS